MIELEHIQRKFQVGDELVRALDDVNLSIAAGEYLSIMGPSGSGKSTLLNLLGLLDKPDSGHYFLDGQDVTALSEVQQAHIRGHKIGFVFQFFHLLPRLTAADNVALPLMLAGVPHHDREQRVNEMLIALGLENRAKHRPDQLSGGQRQRVAIARAAITRPSLLLADEPTGNLDHASGMDVIDILEKLNEQGITLIVVTHDATLGKRSRRKIKMDDGRIIQQ